MRPLFLLLLPLAAGCATTGDESKPRGDGPEPGRAAAQDLVAARKAMMHMAATLTFESVMPAVKNGADVKRQQHAADGLAHFGHSIAGLFPEGSLTPDSRASPAVWTNKADFEARAKAFGDSAAILAQLAEAGDSAGFAAQAGVVSAGCNSCHSLYRRR